MQKISQSEYQHSQLLTNATRHIYSDRFKWFLWRACITPRNNKRRIIRVDGSSICLNQLTVHFRNMSKSSWGSICRPWRSTRLRLTSKAIRWLHNLVLPASLKTLRSKRLWQTFKCLELSRASVSSMPHYPVNNFRAYVAVVGRNSPDFD